MSRLGDFHSNDVGGDGYGETGNSDARRQCVHVVHKTSTPRDASGFTMGMAAAMPQTVRTDLRERRHLHDLVGGSDADGNLHRTRHA